MSAVKLRIVSFLQCAKLMRRKKYIKKINECKVKRRWQSSNGFILLSPLRKVINEHRLKFENLTTTEACSQKISTKISFRKISIFNCSLEACLLDIMYIKHE